MSPDNNGIVDSHGPISGQMPVFALIGGEVMGVQTAEDFVQLTVEDLYDPGKLITEFIYPQDWFDLLSQQPQ